MRLFVLLAAMILLAAAMFTGCGGQPANVARTGNSAAPLNGRNAPPDNVRRVTITELRDALNLGKAVVVDVRGGSAYSQEHIKGALDIPENQLASRAGELPKDKLIVAYCS